MTSVQRFARFVALLTFAGVWLWIGPTRACGADPQPGLVFTSQGKSARINLDGIGLQYFNFSVPNQATWQPGPLLPRGQRADWT